MMLKSNLLINSWVEIFTGGGLLQIASFSSPGRPPGHSLADREPDHLLRGHQGVLVLILLPGDVEQSGVELTSPEIHQEERGSLSSDDDLTLSDDLT